VRDDGYTAPGGQKYKTLELRQIEALEVESIRTLKLQNDALQERVKSLEAGRRPVVSGFGEGGVGLGLAAVAGAILFSSRRKRTEARA